MLSPKRKIACHRYHRSPKYDRHDRPCGCACLCRRRRKRGGGVFCSKCSLIRLSLTLPLSPKKATRERRPHLLAPSTHHLLMFPSARRRFSSNPDRPILSTYREGEAANPRFCKWGLPHRALCGEGRECVCIHKVGRRGCSADDHVRRFLAPQLPSTAVI